MAWGKKKPAVLARRRDNEVRSDLRPMWLVGVARWPPFVFLWPGFAFRRDPDLSPEFPVGIGFLPTREIIQHLFYNVKENPGAF